MIKIRILPLLFAILLLSVSCTKAKLKGAEEQQSKQIAVDPPPSETPHSDYDD